MNATSFIDSACAAGEGKPDYRGTRLGLLLEHGGEAVLDDVRRLFIDVLGWNGEQWLSELDRYRKIILRHYTIPG